VGELIPVGYIPSFMEEIEVNRLPYGREKFKAPDWYVELQRRRKGAA